MISVLSKFCMRRFIPFIAVVAVAVGLAGCGKKPQEASDSMASFSHPSEQTLRTIAQKQGWKVEAVEARDRAFDALDAGRQPSDADWQQLVLAADTEKNGF